MRTLAIDLGSKRVGLALSDEGGRFATPHGVLEVRSPDHAIESVRRVVEDEGVQRIVLGLPLNMDGTVGPMAAMTIGWGTSLAAFTGKPLVYVDERLSSFAAEQSLNDRKRGGEKLTRKGKKTRLDAIAAAGFLQEFLDGKLSPIDPSTDA